MEVLGWILFTLLLVWFFMSTRLSQGKRLHLNYYIVYLLLDDTTRENHKRDFQKWIRESDAKDAMSLSFRACKFLENMADRLAAGDPRNPSTSSVLGAHAMLWQYKKPQCPEKPTPLILIGPHFHDEMPGFTLRLEIWGPIGVLGSGLAITHLRNHLNLHALRVPHHRPRRSFQTCDRVRGGLSGENRGHSEFPMQRFQRCKPPTTRNVN
jgi:hypothetical protein